MHSLVSTCYFLCILIPFEESPHLTADTVMTVWPQSMGIGASLKIQYPIPTEPETPIPNTHKVQNSNTQYSYPQRNAASWQSARQLISLHLRLEPRGRSVFNCEKFDDFFNYVLHRELNPGRARVEKSTATIAHT